MNFWREIVVGGLALALIVHYFPSSKVDETPPVMSTEQAKNQNLEETAYNDGVLTNCLDECTALTQKREMCKGLVAQMVK